MKKVKVAELSGIALDWAVAKCEGRGVTAILNGGTPEVWDNEDIYPYTGQSAYKNRKGGPKYVAENDTPVGLMGNPVEYGWAEFGPIIERKKIRWNDDESGGHYAWIGGHPYYDPLHIPMSEATESVPDPEAFEYGETILIATMRCYVATKMGDEVNIPKELP